MPAFQVIDEILERHTRPTKARRPTHDFGIDDNDSLRHAIILATHKIEFWLLAIGYWLLLQQIQLPPQRLPHA
jgi:hypothetical protein